MQHYQLPLICCSTKVNSFCFVTEKKYERRYEPQWHIDTVMHGGVPQQIHFIYRGSQQTESWQQTDVNGSGFSRGAFYLRLSNGFLK